MRSPRTIRARIASTLLRLVFAHEEAEEIVRDVDELVAGRSRAVGWLLFWWSVAAYPLFEMRERVRDRIERGWGGGTMSGWMEDGLFGFRGLRRRPGFTALVVIILGVALGGVTAVYSVVDRVLFDPLPVDEPDRVVTLWMLDRDGRRSRMTPGNLRDAAELSGVFAGVAAFQSSERVLEDPLGGAPTVLKGGAVSPEYFTILGVSAVRGRTFEPWEGELDADPAVVLSHHVWQQRFGGDPDVVGRWIDLGGERIRVVGVVPPGVYPTAATVSAEIPFTESGQDFFRVLRYGGDYWNLRRPHLLGSVARLQDGVAPESAMAALEALSARIDEAYEPNRGESVVMTSLTSEVVGDVRFGLVTLLAAIGLVFVISAVNVGSLFLLRAEDRAGETAVLVAIGASRERIVRQRVFEAWWVCGLAVVIGAGLAHWMIQAMIRLVPYPIPRLSTVSVDIEAVAVSGLLALILGSLLGVVPSRSGGRSPDKVDGRATASSHTGRLQSVLIGGQAALAVVVLVGALLLTRSFAALQAVDPGFESEATWVAGLRGAGMIGPEVVEAVRGLPGVAAAAMTQNHPLEHNWEDGFILGDDMTAGRDSAGLASIRPFGDGYFEAVGLRRVSGRLPDAVDFAGDLRMAVVNEAFVRVYAAGRETVLGVPVRVPSGDRRLGEGESVFQIVGVVEDVRFLGPTTTPGPAIYLPISHFAVGASTLLVRPERADLEVAGALRTAVRSVDPSIAIDDLTTLETIRARSLARPRFQMMLLAALSGLALLLCSLGAYGIVARTVATRRREIGIRAALGARGAELARSVMWKTLTPMVLGAALGASLGLGAGRALRSLLYEVGPADPVSLVGGPLLLLAVGVLAAGVPSLRATRIDPAESLRSE